MIPARQREFEAIEENANTWMLEAMKENKLTPISQPQLDIKEMDASHAVLTFEFAIQPSVEVGTYKGLKLSQTDTVVKDEEVQAELLRMQKQYADKEEKEGAAEEGDTVNIDYEGLIDGKPFDGGTGKNHNLKLGSHSFIPGFEEGLIGLAAGADKELSLTFPQDYYHEALRGAKAVFKVHINRVEHEVLPEINDDFAKDINAPGVETVEDLRKLVRSRLEDSKKAKAKNTKTTSTTAKPSAPCRATALSPYCAGATKACCNSPSNTSRTKHLRPKPAPTNKPSPRTTASANTNGCATASASPGAPKSTSRWSWTR